MTPPEIRWLTAAQVEAKLRLGIEGPVGRLLEKAPGPSSQLVSYTTEYIPEDRTLTMSPAQADRLLQVLQLYKPAEQAQILVPKTAKYGENVAIHAWGLVFKDQLYVFRFAKNAAGVCQIWCILEGGTDLLVNQDPVVDYVMSIPYLSYL